MCRICRGSVCERRQRRPERLPRRTRTGPPERWSLRRRRGRCHRRCRDRRVCHSWRSPCRYRCHPDAGVAGDAGVGEAGEVATAAGNRGVLVRNGDEGAFELRIDALLIAGAGRAERDVVAAAARLRGDEVAGTEAGEVASTAGDRRTQVGDQLDASRIEGVDAVLRRRAESMEHAALRCHADVAVELGEQRRAAGHRGDP